jgi:uncharacterized cupin superfamily protein
MLFFSFSLPGVPDVSDTLSRPSIVRLNDTATRFSPLALGHADPFAAQRGITWTNDVLAAGQVAWTGGQLDVAAYPHTELAIVSEGALLVETGAATGAPITTRLTAGQAVVLSRGAACRLRADGPVGWSFCAALAPTAKPAPQGLAIDTQAALSPSAPPAADVLLGPVPACRSANAFSDTATGLRVGVWDSTPYARRAVPHRVSELMHILEGAVTLTDEFGIDVRVAAGDTVFVPRGTLCAWTSTVPVRKIYAIQDIRA